MMYISAEHTPLLLTLSKYMYISPAYTHTRLPTLFKCMYISAEHMLTPFPSAPMNTHLIPPHSPSALRYVISYQNPGEQEGEVLVNRNGSGAEL